MAKTRYSSICMLSRVIRWTNLSIALISRKHHYMNSYKMPASCFQASVTDLWSWSKYR